ncbi:MAG: SRPBCC domain-containing protein [Gemmatimonadaceae bacterium]
MEQDAPDRALSTSRVVSATPREVLAAFSDPERLARWWGPMGFTHRFEEFDFRPGGKWCFVMHAPKGGSFRDESEFVEVGPERVVLARRSPPIFELEIRFDEVPGGTRVGWCQRFESSFERDRIASFAMEANEQNLNRLEAELSRVRAPG